MVLQYETLNAFIFDQIMASNFMDLILTTIFLYKTISQNDTSPLSLSMTIFARQIVIECQQFVGEN